MNRRIALTAIGENDAATGTALKNLKSVLVTPV
jgi:hypothetical protein